MDKNKLHQLVAVEQDLVQQSRAILDETITTFTKKAEHFDGLQKIYTPYEEDGEKLPTSEKEVVTTIKEKLDYTSKSLIKAIDATLSKEETNSSGQAKAVLEVDGINFGEYSATSYIALERYLERLREVYKNIPTIDTTHKWTVEEMTGRKLYTTEETTYRSVKKQKAITLAAPTDKHPAQVQLITEEVPAGEYKTTYFSGKITPLAKSNYLEKIDNLILAVKQAREKANQAEVNNIKIGEQLFKYINN